MTRCGITPLNCWGRCLYGRLIPSLQQTSKVADLMERNPIGIVIVMRAVIGGANDVENVVAIELPVHILETVQLDGLLMR